MLVTRNAAARLAVPADRQAAVIDAAPPELDRLVGRDAVHQGVVAEVDPLPERDLADLPEGDLVLALDQVTDPHNVGAILRSAAALGVVAVIVTRRNAPSESGVLAKAASGALEHVPMLRVPNLARAIGELADRGFRTVGLDSDGEVDLPDAIEAGPTALVLGAEGSGLRELTRKRIDALARLDMPGPIRSLNVSNAAAVALYVARRRLGGHDPAGNGT